MIDEKRLEEMYRNGDPEGDRWARAHLRRIGAFDPETSNDAHGKFFRDAVTVRHGDPESAAEMAAWMHEDITLPDWADPERLANGSRFFAEWGVELGIGLFLSSLPLSYASAAGAQVLHLTARLETDVKRRVLESAQFVLDVTAPGGLEPGAQGFISVRHVRLVHAGVRQLIEHDPRIERDESDSPGPHWHEEWGTPINQQHLVGVMLSFSSSLLHVLDKFHVDYDPQGAEDYCLLWNVVGWLLGIEPDVLPVDRTEMDQLETVIRTWNEKESDAGHALTAGLLSTVKSMIRVPLMGGYPATLMRFLIGDPVSDMLGVPKSDWTRVFLGFGQRAARRLSIEATHHRLQRAVMRKVSRSILTSFVDVERQGGRPSFAVPDHLALDIS